MHEHVLEDLRVVLLRALEGPDHKLRSSIEGVLVRLAYLPPRVRRQTEGRQLVNHQATSRINELLGLHHDDAARNPLNLGAHIDERVHALMLGPSDRRYQVTEFLRLPETSDAKSIASAARAVFDLPPA